ncbi:hypothetical protein GOP47_0025418 [Adiantum capillus-veneris]|uniref:Uncharacterized protein n=1 Tax=Adiantum capillus-veneris TaxID=13818 RepID=A0A9D4U239_ADICA|nr:hypothetical protein GOP47_0025418 [Adiantum capillus-veneris]
MNDRVVKKCNADSKAELERVKTFDGGETQKPYRFLKGASFVRTPRSWSAARPSSDPGIGCTSVKDFYIGSSFTSQPKW